MKFLFDLFPIILFFGTFKIWDVFVATGVAIAATIVQVAWVAFRHRKVDALLWMNLAMIVLFAYWQPIGGTVWNLEGATGRTLMNAILGLGFGLVLMASMLINHFDLFGLRQVWLQLIGKPYTELAFRTPLFYRYVRHPLYIGWMMMFWGTPTMSAAHLLFAGGTTAYMLMAMRWEERDLVKLHGAKYERYAQRVPRLIPAATAYSEPALLERKGSAA